MAEKVPQTYANHVRMHPPFHFFLLPAALALLILTIVNVVRHYDLLESWILLLIGVMAPIAILLIRSQSPSGSGSRDPAGGAVAPGSALE